MLISNYKVKYSFLVMHDWCGCLLVLGKITHTSIKE
jgi:hypothetical protein